ncbi:MAG: hypothetical protein HYY82_00485 [Deltaproteobacteria bacterium]|nr:hypothetical protein [Deltaproteobacteria bacterium]
MSARTLSAEVIDAAKQCWVDWFAVAIAALPDPAPSIVRDNFVTEARVERMGRPRADAR